MPPNGTDFTNAVSNFVFIGQTFKEVGNHSLVITPLIPGAFFLDYIIVESPTASFPPKAQIAAVPKPAASESIQHAGPSSSNLSSPETAGSNAGAVAAITLGIILGFLLVSVGWYLLRRRRKIREHLRSENGHRSGVSYAEMTSILANSSPALDCVVDVERGSSNFTPYAVVALERNAFSKIDRQYQNGPTTRADWGRQHATLPPAYSDRAMTQII
ncbi:hypothetical protein K438DRAFT_2002610 [Mycena galopus ATCC 62051]|nr:hypothetical protein K438DRAFT_2002610 [Mycena galopus ATCC 62051]